MSQIPPAPGQPLPSNQPMPPGNYQMPATQSNGWSIASLVVGLVGFCLPVLGGLLAIVFGFLGIRRSKVTRSGSALSIVGLILGILSIGMWALFGGGIFALFKGTAPNRDAAKQLVQDLAAGNITAVQADTDGSISPEDLQTAFDTFKPHGTVTDVTCPVTNVSNGTADVVGVATFSDKSQVSFQMKEVKTGDTWKVSKITLH